MRRSRLKAAQCKALRGTGLAKGPRIDSKAEAKRQVRTAYALPQDIDAAASTARLEHGVLTLKLAKLLPQSKATRLAVN